MVKIFGIKYITLLLIFCSIYFNCACQWNVIYSTNTFLTSVNFVTVDTGFIGGLGLLERTDDGGNNWSACSGFNGENQVWDIDFVSSDLLFLSHFESQPVWTSIDGGFYWENLTDIFVGGPIYDIDVVNDTISYGGGDGGFFYYTKNAFDILNITNIGASDIFSISFPTADTGYVAGGVDAFLKTENGAESWSDINFSPMFNVTIVDFCSASTGYASDGYDLYKTTNYGETWLLLPILSPMDRIIAIECISNEVCYISGDDPLLTTYILKTLDGGETWVNTSFEAHLSAPNKIMCLNDSVCYALSSNGLGTEFYLLKTINSGSMASTYSLDKITIDVYPNPATDLIYIKTNFLEAISSITIIDILGNILIKKNTFEPAIDINNLHSGVYFIEINIDNQRHQFKFIKK